MRAPRPGGRGATRPAPRPTTRPASCGVPRAARRPPLVVGDDRDPPVGGVEGIGGDPAAEPLHRGDGLIAVRYGEVGEEVRGHGFGEGVGDQAAAEDGGVRAGRGPGRGPDAVLDAGVVLVLGDVAEDLGVEDVDGVAGARVDLAPAVRVRLPLGVEAVVGAGLPQAEDGAAGVGGHRGGAVRADRHRVHHHLAAGGADALGAGVGIGGVEVDPPDGGHAAVGLGGEGGDVATAAVGLGVVAVLGARSVGEGPPEELTVEALARLDVRKRGVHPAGCAFHECGHGPVSFRCAGVCTLPTLSAMIRPKTCPQPVDKTIRGKPCGSGRHARARARGAGGAGTRPGRGRAGADFRPECACPAARDPLRPRPGTP